MVRLDLKESLGWNFEVKLGFNNLRSGYVAIFFPQRSHPLYKVSPYNSHNPSLPSTIEVPSLFFTMSFGRLQPSAPLFAVLLPGSPESFKLHLLRSAVEAFFLQGEEEIKWLWNKCGGSEWVRQSSSGWNWGEADLYLAPCVHADQLELVAQSPIPTESVWSQPGKESQCSWYCRIHCGI